jgi:hypothetical protein
VDSRFLFCGRIEIVRNGDAVRMIRMKGIKSPARSWQAPTLISSATLDAELMKTVWEPAKEKNGIWGLYYSGKWDFIDTPRDPDEDAPSVFSGNNISKLPTATVPRPKHVVVRLAVDASFSKTWSLPAEKSVERAREILAMVLREGMQLAPQRSLMICHKAMREIIAPLQIIAPPARAPTVFHVPPWLELAHHGAITGLDKWKTVRAQFVIGRPMPSAEAITLMAEAISGEFIASRNYVQREAAIHVVPDADGHNAIFVDCFEHPHPFAQRLLRRVVWGGVLQEVGRTRYILRERDDPLDIWLLNDVSVPELGAVVPVQWGNDDPDLPVVGPTLDDMMLTTGCWLENTADAKRAHSSLIASPGALRETRSQTKSAAPYLKLIAGGSVAGAFQVVSYRRDAPKTQKARAIFLADLTDNPKAWLEARLGRLAEFETLD